MPPTIGIVSASEYEYATENSMGWCTTCLDFTRECTEPDASAYDCPECGEDCVEGAEEALLMEHIKVVDEEEK